MDGAGCNRRLNLQILQLVPNIFGRLIPVLRIFDQTAIDDSAEVVREGGFDFHHRRGRVFDDRGEKGSRRVTLKRPPSRGHLVKNDADGEDVGTVIDLLAFRLLR